MDVRLFGPIEVSGPAGRLSGSDFPTRKCREVLAALAMARGRVVSKDRIADLLWRERVPRNPAAAVEVAVSLLRSTLARVTAERAVLTESGGYRLDLTVVTIDAVEFDRMVDHARVLPPLEQKAVLADALAFVGGGLLEDETGAEWAQAERDRARRRVERARLDVARISLAHDDAAGASALAELVWIDSDVVHEEAYAIGVAALAQLGRRHDARLLMTELENRLVREEQREPAAATRSLWSLLQPSAAAAPTHRVQVAVPHQLAAVSALPLLGRADHLREIERAIEESLGTGAPGSTAVLIEGAHGMGKTAMLDVLAERLMGRCSPLPVQRLRCQATDAEHPLLALGRLARRVARSVDDAAPLAEDGAAAMFARLCGLLDRLGPAVLLVDDIDLLDAPSLAVVASLLAEESGCTVCLVATRCPSGSGSDPLPRDLRRQVVQLAPLARADVDALGIDEAWVETGGHPGTLAACCTADPVTGLLTTDGVAAILSRVDELGPLGAMVMGAAAGLPQPMSAVDVALASGVGVAAGEVLRRAVALGILREAPGDRVEFVGALLARALSAGRPTFGG